MTPASLLSAWDVQRARIGHWLAHHSPENSNVLMLRAILAATLAAAVAMAVASWPRAPGGPSVSDEFLGASAVALYASACLYLSTQGRYRLSSALAVAGGLLLVGLSYRTYGLRAQSELQMHHLFPMLLACLLLGRQGLWWALAGNLLALALGAWVDIGRDESPLSRSATVSGLALPAMHLLVLAAILDRLIASSQRAIRRGEELRALCRELEQLVEQKELAYARLMHIQRMEAMGRLSAGVAHDFNHVLSVIIGLSTSRSRRSDAIEAILPDIRRAAQHGATLTRRLLNFSRAGERQVAAFDLCGTIEQARPLLLSMLQGEVSANIVIPESEALVLADRDEFVLALLNLAGNASDALQGKGEFLLSVEIEREHAVLRMEDSGIGMAPEVMERVFEPFFTTKPRERGTGMGMAMVHRFVTDCAGTIAIDSRPSAGTRIRISLPLAGSQRPPNDSAGGTE
ncbi:hypothetical protein K4L06_18030 [Lysobacter sp. BMK333-48F3]|uniref:sensor histidine kinase n=1 Tax=Lysobacter sp. BMK333-48F3 TaxID=2867962 RepID=UPI001C8B19AF|nr:ATP-binding protein [Lysobacter sp. BMK333-48F3]MBX9403213.1 hypothetical protein [Lysobacter sp. BMK333-48F3]